MIYDNKFFEYENIRNYVIIDTLINLRKIRTYINYPWMQNGSAGEEWVRPLMKSFYILVT